MIRARRRRGRRGGAAPAGDAGAPPGMPDPVPWTLGQLHAAGSEEFRALLDDARGPDGRVPESAFRDTAALRCQVLGIGRAAWGEACAVMGLAEATLAVLILDRNVHHPATPVRNPGGALRALTARAGEGGRRLDASIFAILRRAPGEQIH